MATHVTHTEPPHGGVGWFLNARHALYCGWVMGVLTNQDHVDWILVVDEDGNYTPFVDIMIGDQPLRLSIPMPDSEWSLTSPVLAHE